MHKWSSTFSEKIVYKRKKTLEITVYSVDILRKIDGIENINKKSNIKFQKTSFSKSTIKTFY